MLFLINIISFVDIHHKCIVKLYHAQKKKPYPYPQAASTSLDSEVSGMNYYIMKMCIVVRQINILHLLEETVLQTKDEKDHADFSH